jgi:hypothetical protein
MDPMVGNRSAIELFGGDLKNCHIIIRAKKILKVIKKIGNTRG